MVRLSNRVSSETGDFLLTLFVRYSLRWQSGERVFTLVTFFKMVYSRPVQTSCWGYSLRSGWTSDLLSRRVTGVELVKAAVYFELLWRDWVRTSMECFELDVSDGMLWTRSFELKTLNGCRSRAAVLLRFLDVLNGNRLETKRILNFHRWD